MDDSHSPVTSFGSVPEDLRGEPPPQTPRETCPSERSKTVTHQRHGSGEVLSDRSMQHVLTKGRNIQPNVIPVRPPLIDNHIGPAIMLFEALQTLCR